MEVLPMSIVRWEPFREFTTLQNEMNRLFNTVFETPAPGNGGSTMRRWMPAMDLLETDDHFVLRADLPGMKEDDVKIEFDDGTLTVRRAQGRARVQEGGLLPRRARVRLVLAVADPAAGDRPGGRRRELRQWRARGPHPEARGAQAAPHRDRGGRSEDHRGLTALAAPPGGAG
jgi:HSP20 family molecular chaperone IbpA